MRHSEDYLKRKKEREERRTKEKSEGKGESQSESESAGRRRSRDESEGMEELERVRKRALKLWVEEMERGTEILRSRMAGGE